MTGDDQRDEAFRRATDATAPADLEWMMVPPAALPRELAGFRTAREGILDNETMAAHGFPGQTVESIEEIGRVTGYLRELAPETLASAETGQLVTAGMVAHLFRDPQAVERWIDEVFLREFLGNVGRIRENGHELLHAEELAVTGFHGRAAAVFAVHDIPSGTLGSTIVDFSIGRLLGVAFVVALGSSENLSLARDLALRLERQVVSVVLG